MNADLQSLIKRIASGESTEDDAEKVKAFVEAFDAWCEVQGYQEPEFGNMLEAREALK